MNWDWYHFLGFLSALLWLLGSVCVLLGRSRRAGYLIMAGTLVTGVLIVGLWIALERPPLRTMGETRLWYAFLLSAAGLLVYRRWPYPWLLVFISALSAVFAIINLARPEIHSKALMPALQSIWFIPHVILYMLSYSLLAASAIASVIALVKLKRGGSLDKGLDGFVNNVVHVGLGFIMLGLIAGAVWAKDAWGHYWSWDPKETWAFVTLATYLIYLHLHRHVGAGRHGRLALLILPLGFIFLMITWLGLPYLPTAPGSVHSY